MGGETMNMEMPVGISDFKEAREGYYVVDKTQFICKLIDTHKKVTLFTRPRRFGKTLTMSMLEYFFSIDRKEDSIQLFSGLAIANAGSAYLKHQGQYPVIFTTLKDFYNPTWESMYQSIRLLTQDIYTPFSYLLDSHKLLPAEKDFVQRMIDGTAVTEEYQVGLKRLSMLLYKHYGIQPIILIDEYDAPLQNAYNEGFYDEALLFWKGWFNGALKDNRALRFAVLTGVLRIAKESIFSGLNNLAVYSVLEGNYSDVFGFTVAEVAQMAKDLHKEEKIPEIKQWYDGYTFGQTEIYNPWSVINYFSKGCKPGAYWVNTSGNSILYQAFRQADAERLQALQDLMDGQCINTTIDDGVIYKDIGKSDSALYSMMLNTGYLKAVHVEDIRSEMEWYEVKIPNEEIKRVYKREILSNIVQGLSANSFLNFQISLLRGETQGVTTKLHDILLKMVSFYDTRPKESFYHGLLLGMTCLLESDAYHVVSNRESGYGRFDLAVFPTNMEDYGIIMEFKVANSEAELEKKAQEALQQIETKAYITEFRKQHVRHVWKYGIAFCGKHVKIVQSI